MAKFVRVFEIPGESGEPKVFWRFPNAVFPGLPKGFCPLPPENNPWSRFNPGCVNPGWGAVRLFGTRLVEGPMRLL